LLQVVSRNAKRLHRLTEDILDVTRIEPKDDKISNIGVCEKSISHDYFRTENRMMDR
jgi:hypothetical protein